MSFERCCFDVLRRPNSPLSTEISKYQNSLEIGKDPPVSTVSQAFTVGYNFLLLVFDIPVRKELERNVCQMCVLIATFLANRPLLPCVKVGTFSEPKNNLATLILYFYYHLAT